MIIPVPKNIFFVWHWQKRLKTGSSGEKIAVEDTLFDAIYHLSTSYNVTIIAISDQEPIEYKDQTTLVRFILCNNQDQLIKRLKEESPDIIFLNHHSKPYNSLLQCVNALNAKTILYYSSPIELNLFDLVNFKRHYGPMAQPVSKITRQVDYHLVHHSFQKERLQKLLSLPPDRIFVAPKSANSDSFFPIKCEKKWDIVYPGRSMEKYWKRPELAIEAASLLKMSLCMPGARLRKQYEHVTIPEGWLDANDLNLIYNQSTILLITSDYREMGPRVIPEAMMCNLPVVCCSDSLACVSHVKRFGGYIAKPNVHDIAKKILMASATVVNTREELIRQDEPNIILHVLQDILSQ